MEEKFSILKERRCLDQGIPSGGDRGKLPGRAPGTPGVDRRRRQRDMLGVVAAGSLYILKRGVTR
jgi:hypothetical protein